VTITTYSGLKSAIADFLNRDDLSAVIPTFVTLAEATFNRRLRDYRMETRSSALFNEPFELLPDDWLETIRLTLLGEGPLQLLSPQDMMRVKANGETGNPRYFAHTATQIELWPEPTAGTGTGELVYFAKIPALSDGYPTNWLLTAAPDLYLYGALLHTAPYLKDDARLAVWGGLYADIMAAMNEESEAARFSGPLKMRLRNGR
jgi:hypothetical protein